MGNQQGSRRRRRNQQQQPQQSLLPPRILENNNNISLVPYVYESSSNANGKVVTPTSPQQQRVRCPSCKEVLFVPQDQDVFYCPCGEELFSPPAPLRTKIQWDNNLENRCVRCLLTTEDHYCRCSAFLNEVNKNKTVSSADIRGRQWERRSVNGNLGWRRLWTTKEEKLVLEREFKFYESLSTEFLNEKSEEELQNKLSKCLIEVGKLKTKEELIQQVFRARFDMATRISEPMLRRLLEIKQIDHSSCTNSFDVAARLFAYEWTDGEIADDIIKNPRTSNGFVRQFHALGESSTETYLSDQYAFDFLMATKIGSELPNTQPFITASTIMEVTTWGFSEKLLWFQEEVNRIRVPWEQGHVRLRVRRSHLLEDSLNIFLKLSPEDMKRFFRFEFIEELGQDAGGVAREWFNQVTEILFDVQFGLFEYNGTGNICYQINPWAAEKMDLRYFRFIGRLIGKALFDGHQLNPHLTRVLYKHILAWPITEEDLKFLDEEVYNSTTQIREIEDVSVLALDFTMNSTKEGSATRVFELKPNGRNIEVTNENRDEYLFLRLQYLTLNEFATPLNQFLLGIYETVPLVLLSVFDYSELELVICGLPDIDVNDWKRFTHYRKEFLSLGEEHPVIKMFWEVMQESTSDQRARFLQFATGTSRVPVQGFSALQGNDGVTRYFTIESVPLEISVFPKAHTCFNRIELPLYTNKEQMIQRISQALSLEGVGFQLE